MKNTRKKRQMKKSAIPVLVVLMAVAVLLLGGLAAHFIIKYTPTKKRADLVEYYGQPAGQEAAIVLGTSRIEEHAFTEADQVYLPLELVTTYLNQRYYWDAAGQQILYATPSELTSTPASDTAGGDVWVKDGAVYLSIPFVQKYTDLDVAVYENPSRVAIQYEFTDVRTVTVLKNTAIRLRGGIKAEVLTNVSIGDRLRLLEELEEWAQVATDDGYIGYIERKRISSPEVTTYERTFEREEYTYHEQESPVNLVWHQVTVMEANAMLSSDISQMSGVNVISPTWFSISDNAGNITSIASADYVNQAHSAGLAVWGLVDNFSPDISTLEILSNTSSRQNLIQCLIYQATSVGMDGINIDFEYLKEETGVHFLEFLRELSVECHKNNLVLSVDNPVPEDFTSHYDRAEQGRVVDYVIIMGYDEHYVGSEAAGSVASLPWVEKGIQDTLEEVSPERVIHAVPFYSRLWTTTGGAVTSEAYGMDKIQQLIAEYKMEVYWDSSVGQNYASAEKDGATYEIWVEDAQSIAAKVRLLHKYQLAGVAAWKLGLENSGIWQVISENLQS